MEAALTGLLKQPRFAGMIDLKSAGLRIPKILTKPRHAPAAIEFDSQLDRRGDLGGSAHGAASFLRLRSSEMDRQFLRGHGICGAGILRLGVHEAVTAGVDARPDQGAGTLTSGIAYGRQLERSRLLAGGRPNAIRSRQIVVEA